VRTVRARLAFVSAAGPLALLLFIAGLGAVAVVAIKPELAKYAAYGVGVIGAFAGFVLAATRRR